MIEMDDFTMLVWQNWYEPFVGHQFIHTREACDMDDLFDELCKEESYYD